MKFIIMGWAIFGIILFSCQSSHKEVVVTESYKPGYGEIMLSMQSRHIKLWYAGVGENWPLADFAIHEIEEALEKIHKYHLDKDETKHVNMMVPAIEAVEMTIDAKDLESFKIQFETLTQTCNTCHQLTKHDYIQIKVPEYNPYSNQIFGDVIVSPVK